MASDIRELRNGFAGKIRGFDTCAVPTATSTDLVRGWADRLAVLVFKQQDTQNDEALVRFGQSFGQLHESITVDRDDMERRLDRKVLSDISNVGGRGEILPDDDPRRIQQRANLIWHTDNSFRRPAGLYTMLAARIVPPVAGETEFADTRAAYDALPAAKRARIDGLEVEHALAHSRFLVGTDKVFEAAEAQRFPATRQPLVRVQERTGRRALYIGSHAWRVVGWSYEDSQALLRELLDFATQQRFVYRHQWEVGDLVMWDNRVTIHRALPFDDAVYRRELRRTSVMLEEPALAEAAS